MLKFISRMERTRNIVLLVFAVLMVVSLIVVYAPQQGNIQGNLMRSEETVAQVGSEEVTVGDVAIQQENASQSGQSATNKDLLDRLINERLVRLEAQRLGLQTADAEVASFIRQQFKPTDGTPFNQKVYEQNVTDRFGSVKNFE